MPPASLSQKMQRSAVGYSSSSPSIEEDEHTRKERATALLVANDAGSSAMMGQYAQSLVGQNLFVSSQSLGKRSGADDLEAPSPKRYGAAPEPPAANNPSSSSNDDFRMMAAQQRLALARELGLSRFPTGNWQNQAAMEFPQADLGMIGSHSAGFLQGDLAEQFLRDQTMFGASNTLIQQRAMPSGMMDGSNLAPYFGQAGMSYSPVGPLNHFIPYHGSQMQDPRLQRQLLATHAGASQQAYTMSAAMPHTYRSSQVVPFTSQGFALSPSQAAPLLPLVSLNREGLIATAEPEPVSDSKLDLPPCDEDRVLPFNSRGRFPLGVDEDPNWLSEFHCFVRCELIEVYKASHEDCKTRNNAIAYHQVGIRCRFCAHLTPTARAGRASAFPSSMRQIYQSFTMMLRDHFGQCESLPTNTRSRFLSLKDKPSQGATDSKRYWIYSAARLGMADSNRGIKIDQQTIAQAQDMPPFGSETRSAMDEEATTLVSPSDRATVTEYYYVLMSQVQLIRLMESECIGNRRSLRVGLPGLGCRYCAREGRMGLCRLFPARRRTLPSKLADLHGHLLRCTLTPQQVKNALQDLRAQRDPSSPERREETEFFDRVWQRMGYGLSST